MPGNSADLRKRLLGAGLTKSAIDAAWPDWWSDDGDRSRSASTELRFALARRLGLSPRALLEGRVEFSRSQNARFKHLTVETAEQQSLLASFGTSLGNLLIRATAQSPVKLSNDPLVLRNAILARRPFVELSDLLALCWGLGIPVIQLRVFPMATKSMYAMVAGANSRHAILMGFDANYPSRAAFTLAHEIGHIALGHLSEDGAIVDLDQIGNRDETDEQEREADQFALALLAGSTKPEITTSLERYNSTSLASAVIEQGPPLGIEPGFFALCLAYQTGEWGKAISALQQIYGDPMPIWRMVNAIADKQIEWDAIGEEAADYLKRVMGAGD